MKCYGKESGPLLKLKKEFFDKNDQILREHLEINRVYAKQPKRKKCKNCDGELGGADFKKLNVEYSFCLQCGHLNGLFEDTKEFCAAVYTEDQGKSYGQQYSAKDKRDYWQRVSDIYQPKAAFLKKALIEQKEATRKLRYIDLGAGSGYFVQALRSEGMVRAKGFEVSEFQVELGNSIGAECGEQVLHRHSLEDITTIAASTNAEVFSMIGVLEHLQHPRAVLRALKENPTARYVFISVPLFSPSVFFEVAFPSVMNRQLIAGHTHLYTESSLDWMASEFKMEKVAEWWFGTDIVDLYRSIIIRLQQEFTGISMQDKWTETLLSVIDNLQRVLDEHHLSSEVHLLYRLGT